jgi:TonB family protein
VCYWAKKEPLKALTAPMTLLAPLRRLSLLLVAHASPTLAQPSSSTPPESPPAKLESDAPRTSPEVTPPELVVQSEAPYPALALEQRVEGNVGLELSLDESGQVVGVKIVQPAGHGFDEAAVSAAKQFRFKPARRGETALASVVQFTYEFHLPPAPAEPASAEPTPLSGGPSTPQAGPANDGKSPALHDTGADQSTLVLASRPISAASSFSVRDRDFQLRPIGSVQDILRVTPGLVLVQHSGGGKANQYFLRGFDADHGTDLALSIDGIPINMVSHAHGQGYSDTNFIIPEVVERVEITKGPYFVGQSDFATAGSVNMVSRDNFEHSSIGFGPSGSPGHGALGYRGLVIASPKFDSWKATFAAELSRSNGPFDNPEGWDKYKLFNKITFALGETSSLSIGEMSYEGNWYGSGQIPARAVDQGLVSRFGSIDPDEGGNTGRHQVYAQYKLRPSKNSEFKALTYLASYRFNLYSNFTLFTRDPDYGDEIEQVDRRTIYGARLSYRIVQQLKGVRFDTTIGADGRGDDIHNELWSTVHRKRLLALRNNDVSETLMGAYVNEEISPFQWVRLNVGGRADMLNFAVTAYGPSGSDAPPGGVGSAQIFTPKASLIVTPLQKPAANLDLYANYGQGFHSNDVRGAFASDPVSPLTRATGAEVGARTRLWNRWDLAGALWQLDLDSETVWSGDEGTTEVGGATRRAGIELETRCEFTPWLAADLDLTFTDSKFRENAGNANAVALAPKETWSGGLSARHELGPGVLRGGLRFYGIGDRPATEDGELIAPGFTQFDLHLGYRHRRFDLALDIENLFNGQFRSAQFATTSRLRTEPGIGRPVPADFSCGNNARPAPAPDGSPADGQYYGCEDVAYTPAYPLTARFMATLFLD